MNEYTFERLSYSNVKDSHWLFKESSKRSKSLTETKKKFNTTYTNCEFLGYIAYDPLMRPAAFYALIPTIASYQGETILIAQAVDAITHPLHQRKGLFSALARKTHELAKEEGVHFIYGAPNENSYHGLVHTLNFKHIGNMKIVEVKLPMIPINQIFRTNSGLKFFYSLWVELILQFFKTSKDISAFQDCDEPLLGITRDDAYLQYKQYTKKYILSICNKNIWVKFEGTLKIGDIEKCSKLEMESVIRKLKILAFFTGIRKIRYQSTTNKEQNIALTSHATIREGLPVIFLDFRKKFNLNNFVITYADLDTF